MVGILVGVLALWTVFWKGIALWMAARRDHLAWYVILLVLNTVGILEMVYIFSVAPKQPDLVSETPRTG
jgi:hypothetical protein